MRRIYKYSLKTYERGEFSAYMPRIARIIKCGFQKEVPTIWALVDEDEYDIREIPFLIMPTGGEVDETAHHLETVFNGDLVWHFFVVEGSHGVSAHP